MSVSLLQSYTAASVSHRKLYVASLLESEQYHAIIYEFIDLKCENLALGYEEDELVTSSSSRKYVMTSMCLAFLTYSDSQAKHDAMIIKLDIDGS